MCAGTDSLELQKLDDALRRSEDRFQAIFNLAAVSRR